MKRILFSLLILAGYAAANSCTDLIANNNDSFIASGNVHRDSSYFLENGDNAWSHKYTWNDGKLESIRFDPMRESESPFVEPVYWNADETALTGKRSEIIVTQRTSGDTIIYVQKNFYEGELEDSVTYKKINGHIYALSHTPGNSNWSDIWTFNDTYLSNDTVYHKTIYDYYTDNPRYYTQYIVGDPDNALKCFEYEENENEPKLLETVELVYTENGFMFRYNKSSEDYSYLREFFFVYNEEGSTAIRKQRPAVKISPKARYFDLLGRYKFSK
jgi:hypothetical protein